jgi:hypothetical protein
MPPTKRSLDQTEKGHFDVQTTVWTWNSRSTIKVPSYPLNLEQLTSSSSTKYQLFHVWRPLPCAGACVAIPNKQETVVGGVQSGLADVPHGRQT